MSSRRRELFEAIFREQAKIKSYVNELEEHSTSLEIYVEDLAELPPDNVDDYRYKDYDEFWERYVNGPGRDDRDLRGHTYPIVEAAFKAGRKLKDEE